MTAFDTTIMLFSIGPGSLACYLVAAKLADLPFFFIWSDTISTTKKQVSVDQKQVRYGLSYKSLR